MKKLLTAIASLVVGLLPAAGATIVQSATMAAGTLQDGDSASLTVNPSFTATQIANASELRITLSLTGAAHMLTTSLTPNGLQHDAELMTWVTFKQGSTIDLMSPQFSVFDARPFIVGLGSIDSTAGPDTSLSYSAEFVTSDLSLIQSLTGSSMTFDATPEHELGENSLFARDFGGITDFSNQRVESSMFEVQYALTTVPEPTSSVLILLSGIMVTFRRRRA